MLQNSDDVQLSQRRLKRLTFAQRILDITVIGAALMWFVLLQLRWMILGLPPTGLDIFVALAFVAMSGALWLNHHSRASFNQLSQSEDLRRQLEDVMSSMADVMIVMSPTTIIQRVNKVALERLGYSREEMIGQSISHFMVQGGKPTSMGLLHQTGSVRLTRSFRTQSGRLLPMAVTYTAVTSRDGMLQGVLCVAQELTEVEAMRVKLQATSQRYNTAITSSRLGVYEYDPHNNQLVVDSNLKLLKSGQARELKTLDSALSYIPIEDHAKVYTALNHVLTGKTEHIDLEIRFDSPTYGVRWLHVRGAMKETDGRLKPPKTR
jgi:PAS domain S-box-containing protein